MTPQLLPNPVGAPDAPLDYTPDNPQVGNPDDNLASTITDEDKNKLVEIITQYRTGWAPDRLLRLPKWMKNQFMYRGNQVLGWDPAQGVVFDALAWYRNSGNASDGEDTELEKYINNITKMGCRGFVGTLARGVPPTVVKPEDARVLADRATAEFGQKAVSIIERINDINRLVRREATLLFLFGMYVKHTRVVIDGALAGYEDEPQFGPVSIQKPDRFLCPKCSAETPIEQVDQQTPQCPQCRAPLGPADWYQAESIRGEGQIGTKRTPRAMVKWSLYGPLEFDADPNANDLRESAIKCIDREIDIGTARRTFKGAADEINEGEQTTTTPNAGYEQLRRMEAYSLGYAYTSDAFRSKVTYSQVWMEPDSYYRITDKEPGEDGQSFADRMTALGPEGLKVSMVGKKVVDVRACDPSKELTLCFLQEGCGIYSPSIAEDVVPFNERLNDAMNLIDSYFNHCAAGITIADASRIDRRELEGKVMSPGVINFMQTKGEGMEQPLANSIFQFQFKLDQNIMNYPGTLIAMDQQISGITAQLQGTGTAEGVDTYHGQQLQVNLSETGISQYWENLKAEHAQAGENAIWHLQKAHENGLMSEIWDVEEAEGSEFRNNYVDLNKMEGHVRVYPKIDEGLPQSPEQIRDVAKMIFEEAGKGNPLATEIVEPVSNQEILVASVLGNEFVLPQSTQRSRTLQHVNILMESDPRVALDPQTGQPVPDLPVKPELYVDDWVTLKATIKEFRRENWDQAKNNPQGWAMLDQYFKMALELEMQEAAEDAARKQKVQAAGQPQEDPTTQQEKALLVQHAAAAVERNAQIGSSPPAPSGVQIGPVVQANKGIIDSALKAVQ